MTLETFGDIEGALRTHMRADAGLIAAVNARVFFSIPKTTGYPLITLSRVGGGDSPGEAPIDEALIQFDVWATKEAGKSSATAAALALRAYLHAFRSATALTASVRCFGADVLLDRYSPDPVTQQPRYLLTARVLHIAV